MQIQLEQVRKQLNSMKECQKKLFQLEEQLAQVAGSSTMRQEPFINIQKALKMQQDKLMVQIDKLNYLMEVLDKTTEYIQSTEESIVRIYSEGRYRFIRPVIRMMVIQHVIPLPDMVLD